jgi:hypothetical protein
MVMTNGGGNRSQVSYVGAFEVSVRDSLGVFIDPLATRRALQPFRKIQPGLRIGGVPLWKQSASVLCRNGVYVLQA